MRPRAAIAGLGVLAALAAGGGAIGSGATFSSSSPNAGNGVSAARDWTPPTVALTNPGSPLRGTVALQATATDDVSGVASVVFQRAANGSSSFTTICTDTTAPYTCAWDTSALALGKYDLRAVATDVDGNQRISSLVDSRWVDNSTPSVTLADPGSPLRGTATLGATATSASGVGSVELQRAPAGTSTWTSVCTSASATPSCSWDTTAVADGGYDLRAVLTTSSGLTATSAVVGARRVDNTAPRGADVQAQNKVGGTAGRLEAGDSLTLTYSEAMQPGSLVSGWSGTSSAALVVRVTDGTPDVLSFTAASGGGTPNLGSVALPGNMVSPLLGSAITFAATASLNAAGTTVTITLGALQTSPLIASPTTTTQAGAMVWTPSASALDLAGNPASTAATTETGAADVDF